MRLRSALVTAALAGTLVVAGCGDRSGADASAADPSAGDEPTGPVGASDVAEDSEIPEDFPLASGMGGPDDTIATSRTGTGLRDLTLCDTAPLRGLGTRDRMVADNSGGESANTRELVLLGSPEEALQVAKAFADLPASCPSPEVTGDTETVTEVRESAFGPGPAATLVQTYTFDGEPGTGATVIHVVPVGAALLVTSTYGQWTGDTLEDGVAETVDAVRRTVSALARFGDEPTEPTESSTAAAEVTPIPDDFPLAIGLPQDDGETKVSPPSADGDGMGEVEMCGGVVWPVDDTAGGTRRLVTGALGPEYFDGRELVVHADAEAAADAMTAIREAAEGCRTSGNQVWTVLERDTGYDTVTMGLTYDDGLGSSVFQVTRVGSARLMVSTYGEGSLASLDQQADGVTGTTGEIVQAMCVFTKTGC
jgi:hypothetical protein